MFFFDKLVLYKFLGNGKWKWWKWVDYVWESQSKNIFCEGLYVCVWGPRGVWGWEWGGLAPYRPRWPILVNITDTHPIVLLYKPTFTQQCTNTFFRPHPKTPPQRIASLLYKQWRKKIVLIVNENLELEVSCLNEQTNILPQRLLLKLIFMTMVMMMMISRGGFGKFLL